MLDRFQAQLGNSIPVVAGDKVVLALSGGMDSMLLWYLLRECGIEHEVAHCNFNLRKGESDTDQQFLEEEAEKYGIPIHIISFDTEKYADEYGISIQMAARELRYNWFEQIRSEIGARYVLTAHHADDQLETFFINLMRGSGLNGLSGIPMQRDRILRPLLEFYRDEISNFVAENKISYREDSSNADIKYLRNNLRHKLIPELIDIAPQAKSSILTSIHILKDQNKLFQDLLRQQIDKIISPQGDMQVIDIPKLKQIDGFASLLYAIIGELGFNRDQHQDIVEALDAESGKQFEANGFRIVKDRSKLFLVPESAEERIYMLESKNKQIQLANFKLTLESKGIQHVNIRQTEHYAYFDADEIEWPLMIRRWKKGDYFYPFTKGIAEGDIAKAKKKKISDYFTDQKLSIPEKEREWIMESGEKICWVIGRRTDHRFRVKPSTKKVLVLRKIEKGER